MMMGEALHTELDSSDKDFPNKGDYRDKHNTFQPECLVHKIRRV